MSRFYPHPIIAREGWPFIIISLIVSLLISFCGGWWSLPFWIISLFVVQFFRDPARDTPADTNAILSPADGRIVVIEKTADPYRDNADALKISVFMNVFNVHSNRSPIDGTVERVEYFHGSFLNAALDKASVQNERNAVLARTKAGHDITFVQVAGLVARRILCYVKIGDVLSRGDRYGFIRFGSRVDLYLPPSSTPVVSIGDKVQAATSVLAYFADKQNEDTPENTDTALATALPNNDDIIAAAQLAQKAAEHIGAESNEAAK
ncbi:phosphatidylserine decarboxylase [Stenoxybacter acetivorans]|uniref:phosphatidylserine decarboxylase n=1 Tax=Stenoxybacter acetivorans TaxID=422441 RepID=UPI00056AE0C7|nr:phosphatidylserine decarboxylase [Stenoxybacter acetivorans]